MSRPKNLESLIASLQDRMEKHHEEVDKRLDNIEKVMIAQEMNVKEHMRRSDNLELLVSHNREQQEKEVKPLQRHVFMVEGALKLLGVLALLVTIISGLAKLFGAI